MKRLFTLVLICFFLGARAHQPDDSLVRLRLSQMNVVAEVWKMNQFTDSSMCAMYCPSFRGIPVYMHLGMFPTGSEFDFMDAKKDDVLGPYVDGNCISLYKFIGHESVPDSVKFSQILVSWQGAVGAEPYVTRSKEEARARADSLCYELRVGRIFMDEIMVMESDDVSGLIFNQGEYGWITRKSRYPQSIIEASFSHPPGSFVIAESERGYHVIGIEQQSLLWDCFAAWEIAWCIDSCYDLKGNAVASEAVFPGGGKAMDQYFYSEKTKYDSLDVAGQFDFPVLVFFDVMEDGSVSHVEVLQQYWVTPGIVRDITLLLKAMPKWIPAQTCNGPVKEGQVVVIYL